MSCATAAGPRKPTVMLLNYFSEEAVTFVVRHFLRFERKLAIQE